MLVLRSDMTIPIARVVATRYATRRAAAALLLLRRTPTARVRPQRGQAREMLQAGIELVGAPGPEGTAEALDACCARRSTPPGWTDYRIGLGDASLYPRAARRASGCPTRRAAAILHELVTRDFVGLEREVEALRLGGDGRCCDVPQLRGGAEVLDVGGPAAEPAARACYDAAGARAWPSA